MIYSDCVHDNVFNSRIDKIIAIILYGRIALRIAHEDSRPICSLYAVFSYATLKVTIMALSNGMMYYKSYSHHVNVLRFFE